MFCVMIKEKWEKWLMGERESGREEGFYLHLEDAESGGTWQFTCEYDLKVLGLD